MVELPIEAQADRDLAIKEAEAILQCLTYLEAEAAKIGLRLTAHLIGVAAATVVDTIERTKAEAPANACNSKHQFESKRILDDRPAPITINGVKK